MEPITQTRRRTMKLAGGLALGLAGVAAGSQRVAARGGDPSITFNDQTALALPEPSKMEAAVNTKDVYMPDGGWVVVLNASGSPIGRSMRKLPAGRFKELKVACRRQGAGEHPLVAMLMKDLKSQTPYMGQDGPVSDSAMVTFP